jgi:hypothetical protein
VRFVPFITRTRSTTLAEPTSDTATIEATALDMLDQFAARRPVRLVGGPSRLRPLIDDEVLEYGSRKARAKLGEETGQRARCGGVGDIGRRPVLGGSRWPPLVVVGAVLGEDGPQVPLAEDQDVDCQLGSGGQHEAFGEAVRSRAAGRDLDGVDAACRFTLDPGKVVG